MKWKKRANQSLVIALTFALALTMNVPFVAWGAGDSEPVAEVAGQQSDDDRVASATQPLESQATPEDDNRSDPANNGPVPENGNAMVGEPSTRALPSASPAGETVGAIGPLRIFYTLDSGDERQIGSGLNDDEKSVLDELNLDPATFEVLHLRLVAAEGFSFEKGSGYQLTDVSVSWQAITADGMTLSYGIDLRSEGDSLVCDIPSVLLRNVSNGEYERFAISWTADGAPPEIHGAAFGSYLGFNLFKTGTAAAFETDSIMGTYLSGNGTAIVIAKSSGGRTIAIADEVGSNGSPAVSTFKDVAIACDSAGEPYRTEVSVNYSANAKFELGADADGNRTLTSLESCTYRTAQGPNAGSISKGQVFTQAMVASVQGAKYPTVQAAINAAQTGETVILLEDVQENVIVPAGKSVVLDLNGQVVEGAPNADTVTVEGALTVKDGTADANPVVSDDYGSVTYAAGKILGKSPTTEPYAKALHVQNGGSATIESGIVESEDSDAAFVSKGSTLTVNGGYFHSAEFGIGVQGEGATLVMSGGAVVADNNAAIGGNGKDEAESRDTSISISGGTVISHIDADGYIACGIYHPQRGKLSITGGTVYADNGVGVLLRGGTLDMTDGTVIATGNASGQVGDSTIVQSCYGVQIDGASAYYDSANAKATITGGLVKAGENVPALNVVAPGTMTANGGMFSSDVTEYLGAGRIIKENSDGMFVVESDQVASITGANGEVRKTYSSLSGAFSSVKDGETVTLLKDVPAADAQYSVSNKSFTLDLNNYSIDGTRYFTLYINRYGEPVDVTIKNGTIRNTWNEADNGPLGVAVWANQNVNLTLDNVVLEAAEAPGGKQSFGLRIGNASGNTSNPSVTIKGEDTEIAGATAGISVIGNGASAVSSLTLEAGTVSGSDFGIVGNGDCDGTSIEIKGGTVRSTSKDGCAIYHPQDGDLAVSGGTLEGANGVQFCGEGKLSIESGSINATAAEIASPDTTTTSSSILDGAALSIVSRGGGGYGAAGSAEVSITGGTLTSANNAAIQEYAVGDAGSLIKSLAISQPEGKTLTVSSASGKPAVSLSALTGNASKVISGGAFSSDVKDYCAAGYTTRAKDDGSGMFDVVGNHEAAIGDVRYATFADALQNAKDGDTVSLLRDAEIGYAFIRHAGTIDLGGHTLIGDHSLYNVMYQSSSYGGDSVLTIQNGTIKCLQGKAPYFDKGTVVYKNLNVISGSPDFSSEAKATYLAKNASLSKGPHLIVEEDCVLTACSKTKAYGIDVRGEGSALDLYGTLRISTENGAAITGNGSEGEGGTVINIHPSAVVDGGAAGFGIFHPQEGELNVLGGAIAGATGIEMRSGMLSVSGEALVTGTASSLDVNPNSNGATTVGAGIAVAQHVTKHPISVTVSNGTISGYAALYESNPEKNLSDDLARITLSVTGGTFNAKNNGEAAVYSEDKVDFITGGAFNKVLDTKYYDEGIYRQNAQDATDAPGSVVPRAFEIKYDLGGGMLAGTAKNPASYTYFDESFTLANPERAGYTFAGWTGSGIDDGAESVTIAKGSTGDRSFTATWTVNTDTAYTVEHYQQNLDGTYALAETDSLTGETDATVTAAPKAYEGFTLNEDAQGTVASGTIAGDGSLVLKLCYDRNSYEVSYAYTGDAPASAPSLPTKATAKFGETVAPAAAPTMTGYAFSGWSRAEAFAMPAENVAITGSWTANTDVAYTVHYYLHGTTTRLSDDKVVEGRTFGQSYDEQAPAIEGYALEGAAVQRIVLDAYGKELTFSYTAKEARIVFEANGGSQVADLVGKTGEQVAGSLPAPSREGYAFAGWYADKALTEPVSALPATYPAGATTYYAKWNAVPLPPGETGNVEIQVEVPAPSVDGSPHATVTEESVEAAAKHAASVLEAIEKDEAPVGMTAEDAQKVAGLVSGADTADVRVVVSLGFEKKGEDEVDDSEKDAIGGAASDGESVQLYLDLSVKMVVQVVKNGSVQAEHEAVLGEVEEPLLFEVHVDPGLVASKSVRIAHVHGYEHDTEIIVPESIDRDRGIVRFYASKFSTYALLASESVAVDFEANGGSAVASQTIGFGGKVARPDDPTRAGYTFGGWFVDEGCTQAFDFDTPVERPLTLFAKWTAVDPGPGPNPDPDPSPNPDPDPGTDPGADHKPGDNGGSDLKPLDASSKAVGTKRLVGTGDGAGAFAASLAGVAALAVASALAAALRRRRSR